MSRLAPLVAVTQCTVAIVADPLKTRQGVGGALLPDPPDQSGLTAQSGHSV